MYAFGSAMIDDDLYQDPCSFGLRSRRQDREIDELKHALYNQSYQYPRTLETINQEPDTQLLSTIGYFYSR